MLAGTQIIFTGNSYSSALLSDNQKSTHGNSQVRYSIFVLSLIKEHTCTVFYSLDIEITFKLLGENLFLNKWKYNG